jgi:hypothetical protein
MLTGFVDRQRRLVLVRASVVNSPVPLIKVVAVALAELDIGLVPIAGGLFPILAALEAVLRLLDNLLVSAFVGFRAAIVVPADGGDKGALKGWH